MVYVKARCDAAAALRDDGAPAAADALPHLGLCPRSDHQRLAAVTVVRTALHVQALTHGALFERYSGATEWNTRR